MAKRVSFSREHLELNDIAIHHSDTESSLRSFFSDSCLYSKERFVGYTQENILNELGDRLNELEHSSSFSLLATIEATFRIDYLQRCYKKQTDTLSRSFRAIYKQKKSRASLEEDILEAWKENYDGISQIIGHLKGAFYYRHWIAHGRYWSPKTGRKKYDYDTVFTIAETVLNSFPFEGLSA